MNISIYPTSRSAYRVRYSAFIIPGTLENINTMKKLINKIHLGDCLDIMRNINSNSIDMILCDLPYGTTKCSWDEIIPFDLLWNQYTRIAKTNCAIVLTASQPFTSRLVNSNIKMFKYSWIWQKDAGSNFATVKYQPMKEHEDVLIFCKSKTIYNPIKQERIGSRKGRETASVDSGRINSVYGTQKGGMLLAVPEMRVPSSVQKFKRERGLHPTQKPVPLFEYLIKTYTNRGDLVLDNCIGSGTTAIACINTDRQFIGIEKDEKYFYASEKRVTDHMLLL